MKRFVLFFLVLVFLSAAQSWAQSESGDSGESSNWSKVLEMLEGVPDDQMIEMSAKTLRMWATDSLNLVQTLSKSEAELETLKNGLVDFNQKFQTLENNLKTSADRLLELSERLSKPTIGAEAGVTYFPGKEGDVGFYAGFNISF